MLSFWQPRAEVLAVSRSPALSGERFVCHGGLRIDFISPSVLLKSEHFSGLADDAAGGLLVRRYAFVVCSGRLHQCFRYQDFR